MEESQKVEEAKVIPGEIKDRPLKRKPMVQTIRVDNLPKDVKDALGIVNGQKSYSEFLESDPVIQESLKKIHEITENAVQGIAVPQGEGDGGHRSAGVPQEAIEERNTTIIDLYCMGLTPRTVLSTINDRNRIKNRGHIETEKGLRKIITDYFSKMRPSSSEDMNVYDEAMKEASYAAQEKVIERLTLIVANRVPERRKSDFEFAIVLEKLIQAHQLRIENHGWNKSRANPLIMNQQNNQINVINQNVDSYAVKGVKEAKVQELLDKLDKILGD